MIYAYIRVSTEKQSVEGQRYECLNAAHEKKWHIDEWVEETVSGGKDFEARKLGELMGRAKKGDIIITPEITRLGRKMLDVMEILNRCMRSHVKVYITKDKWEIGDTLNDHILAFAFSLSGEIERRFGQMRTVEGIAYKRSQTPDGKWGRPTGKKSKTTKLTGYEERIKFYLSKGLSHQDIARIYDVDRKTVNRFIRNHNLTPEDRKKKNTQPINP
jgi:DNA invertase Pin-like site-specific DNA recombinase